jgi:hypothetical protein
MNFGKLAIKYDSVPVTSAPSEHILSQAARVLNVKQNRMREDVTAAMMYCRENKHIYHKLGWICQDLCLLATPPKLQTFVSVANMLKCWPNTLAAFF